LSALYNLLGAALSFDLKVKFDAQGQQSHVEKHVKKYLVLMFK
jgi:hypothetical protein